MYLEFSSSFYLHMQKGTYKRKKNLKKNTKVSIVDI
jgi:hypothetical protein